MSLDLNLLEDVRKDGEKLVARCPACAERGHDKKGDHLCIFPNGAFHCIAFSEDPGHNQRIFELVGLRRGRVRSPAQWVPHVQKVEPRPTPKIPCLHKLTHNERVELCRIRDWPSDIMPVLELLWEYRLLFYADVYDDGQTWPSWLITDYAKRGAQARRLDGMEWEGISAKAKSLPGSSSSWPIGAANIEDRPIVLLCEGQPDFVAALPIAFIEGAPLHKIAPVCMAGAGNRIHEDALDFFKAKRVRIFSHPDDAGQTGAAKWAAQLQTVGAKVDGFTFSGIALANGKPVKDLADYLTFLKGTLSVSTHVIRDLWDTMASHKITHLPIG